jgi:hypothetical protein
MDKTPLGRSRTIVGRPLSSKRHAFFSKNVSTKRKTNTFALYRHAFAKQTAKHAPKANKRVTVLSPYAWAAIRRRAGLDGVRLHDLRHSYASVGAGAGLGLPIIGRLLGHKQAATTARYAHLADDPLRRASELIAAHIADEIGELKVGGGLQNGLDVRHRAG